jgi:hypothetical protein
MEGIFTVPGPAHHHSFEVDSITHFSVLDTWSITTPKACTGYTAAVIYTSGFHNLTRVAVWERLADLGIPYSDV